MVYQSYVFEINDWEPTYSFGLDRAYHRKGPYIEYLELSLSSTLIAPTKLKGRGATILLLASRRDVQRLERPDSDNQEPIGVGELTIRGDRMEYLGGLPYDAVWGMAAALAAGRIQMCVLRGIALKRGKAKIESAHFEREVDLEEWM